MKFLKPQKEYIEMLKLHDAIFMQLWRFATLMKKWGYPFVDSNYEAILFLSFFESLNAISIIQLLNWSEGLSIKLQFVFFFVFFTILNYVLLISKGLCKGIHQRYSEMSKIQKLVSLYISLAYFITTIAALFICREFIE